MTVLGMPGVCMPRPDDCRTRRRRLQLYEFVRLEHRLDSSCHRFSKLSFPSPRMVLMDDRERSRRSILKFAGLLAGASLASGLPVARDALAQQKASKEAMKYQDK